MTTAKKTSSKKAWMSFARLLRISRPRFRIYELGPYMIGILAGFLASGYSRWQVDGWRIILFWVYFLLPVNIWLYGINDIYDYETDKHNPKKQEYEALVLPSEQPALRKRIIVTTLPFLFILPLQASVIISFLVFLFFSSQYSAKPLRAKAVPIIDSLVSAWHYIGTAVFSFYLVYANGAITRSYVIAGAAWAIAMHAYSAVPDIKADKDANLATIATLLGRNTTLVMCLLMYGFATYIAIWFGWYILGTLGVIYCGLMGISLFATSDKQLFAIYKIFPWVNTTSGMILFFMILLRIILY